jgi:hypothetical protein
VTTVTPGRGFGFSTGFAAAVGFWTGLAATGLGLAALDRSAVFGSDRRLGRTVGRGGAWTDRGCTVGLGEGATGRARAGWLRAAGRVDLVVGVGFGLVTGLGCGVAKGWGSGRTLGGGSGVGSGATVTGGGSSSSASAVGASAPTPSTTTQTAASFADR